MKTHQHNLSDGSQITHHADQPGAVYLWASRSPVMLAPWEARRLATTLLHDVGEIEDGGAPCSAISAATSAPDAMPSTDELRRHPNAKLWECPCGRWYSDAGPGPEPSCPYCTLRKIAELPDRDECGDPIRLAEARDIARASVGPEQEQRPSSEQAGSIPAPVGAAASSAGKSRDERVRLPQGDEASVDAAAERQSCMCGLTYGDPGQWPFIDDGVVHRVDGPCYLADDEGTLREAKAASDVEADDLAEIADSLDRIARGLKDHDFCERDGRGCGLCFAKRQYPDHDAKRLRELRSAPSATVAFDLTWVQMARHFLNEYVCDLHDHGCKCDVCAFMEVRPSAPSQEQDA